ncbi:MAG TPA: hypothetical protein PK673_07940 [Paludibacteraceae bacterium]|nr:hypothetical protein [Paludibacteraceae bacterium]
MTLTEINTQFKAVTGAITGLNGYSFGYWSDRIRSQTYDEPGEDQTDLYPRVFWVVPTMNQDVINRNDIYKCEVVFDDLLGYDDTGETDLSTQVEKWDLLMQLATRWVKQMQGYVITGVVQGQVSYTLDSFGGSQRLISVIASFDFVTKSIC